MKRSEAQENLSQNQVEILKNYYETYNFSYQKVVGSLKWQFRVWSKSIPATHSSIHSNF